MARGNQRDKAREKNQKELGAQVRASSPALRLLIPLPTASIIRYPNTCINHF